MLQTHYVLQYDKSAEMLTKSAHTYFSIMFLNWAFYPTCPTILSPRLVSIMTMCAQITIWRCHRFYPSRKIMPSSVPCGVNWMVISAIPTSFKTLFRFFNIFLDSSRWTISLDKQECTTHHVHNLTVRTTILSIN